MALPTVPPAQQGAVYDPIVYNAALSAASKTSVAATTLFSPTTSGTFRLAVMCSITAVGGGTGTGASTSAVNVIYQDPNASGAQTDSAVATFTVGASGDSPAYTGTAGRAALSTGVQEKTFRAAAGTAIQVSTTYTVNGGLTTAPTLQHFVTLECLGQ